jgi:dihydroorotase
MKILIKGGRVLDPAQGMDDILDLLIEDGRISKIAKDIKVSEAQLIDAKDQLVTPGLVDIHVHLRDPGYEYKEDIVTGTRAAAAGGFTSVACMPNTNPINDHKSVTRYILGKAREEGYANVFPIGSITKALKGESLVEMGDLKEAGCVGFSDDGLPVLSGDVMRRAMEYAKGFDMPIVSHSEDTSLTAGGVMNEGFVATELGLKGIPWVAESAAIAREVMLAEFTGARLHVCHISTRSSLEFIRAAKKRGVRVTCEVTPHHFSLTEEAVRGCNTNAKMGPPLRTADDLAAMHEGLADGTIDAIASDHAPHHLDDKNVEFNIAANGLVGLETTLPLTLKLVEKGVLSLNDAIARLTCRPSKVLNIPRGTLKKGVPADVTIIDPNLKWTVVASKLNSKAKNTPFDGWEMKGAATYTVLGGKIVYQRK